MSAKYHVFGDESITNNIRKNTEWSHLSNETAWELILKIKDNLANLGLGTSSRVLSSASKITKYKSDHSIEKIYKRMNPQIAKFNFAQNKEAIEGELVNFSLNIK